MTFLVQLFFTPRQFILQLTFDVLPNFQLSNASYVRSNEVIFQERYSFAVAIDSTNPLAHRKLSNVDLTPIEKYFWRFEKLLCFAREGRPQVYSWLQEIVADRPGEYTICWSAVPSVSLGRITCHSSTATPWYATIQFHFFWFLLEIAQGTRWISQHLLVCSLFWSPHCSKLLSTTQLLKQETTGPQVHVVHVLQIRNQVLLVTRPFCTVNRQLKAWGMEYLCAVDRCSWILSET